MEIKIFASTLIYHFFFCFAKILNETKSLSLRNPTPSQELSFSQIWLFLEQINSPFQPSVVVSRSQSARNVCTTSRIRGRKRNMNLKLARFVKTTTQGGKS